MAKFLGWTGWVVIGLAGIAALVYSQRSDPISWMAGRALTGPVVEEPVTDWSFSDEHPLIALETRPAKPHSVTVVCAAHGGKLYVPANGGSGKSWTYFAVAEPHVRVKIGDKVYPARATRVTDPEEARQVTEAFRAKYDFIRDREIPPDVWLFRVESRGAEDGAAPTAAAR
jgi:hypothetical protein